MKNQRLSRGRVQKGKRRKGGGWESTGKAAYALSDPGSGHRTVTICLKDPGEKREKLVLGETSYMKKASRSGTGTLLVRSKNCGKVVILTAQMS